MLVRLVFCAALLAVAAYGVWEVRRWSDPGFADVISPKQRRLRAWGFFFLLASLGLCLRWTYLPKPHTPRELIDDAQYIILICLAVLPLLPLALLDWRENLRHLSESRKRLFQETIGPLAQPSDSPPTTPA